MKTLKYKTYTILTDRESASKVYSNDIVYCEVMDIEETSSYLWRQERVVSIPKKLKFTDEQIKFMLGKIAYMVGESYSDGKKQKELDLRVILGLEEK